MSPEADDETGSFRPRLPLFALFQLRHRVFKEMCQGTRVTLRSVTGCSKFENNVLRAPVRFFVILDGSG